MFRLLIVCAELGVIKAEGLENPNRGWTVPELDSLVPDEHTMYFWICYKRKVYASPSWKSFMPRAWRIQTEAEPLANTFLPTERVCARTTAMISVSWTVLEFDSLVPDEHTTVLLDMLQKQSLCFTELEILYAQGLENAMYKQWCFQLWREIQFCQRRGTSPHDALLHQVIAWCLTGVRSWDRSCQYWLAFFGLLQRWCDG